MENIQEYICLKQLESGFGEVILFKDDLLQNCIDNSEFYKLVKDDMDNITVYFLDRDEDDDSNQTSKVKNKFKWLIESGYIKFNRDIPYNETLDFKRDVEVLSEKIENQRTKVEQHKLYLVTLLEEYYSLTKDIVKNEEE